MYQLPPISVGSLVIVDEPYVAQCLHEYLVNLILVSRYVIRLTPKQIVARRILSIDVRHPKPIDHLFSRGSGHSIGSSTARIATWDSFIMKLTHELTKERIENLYRKCGYILHPNGGCGYFEDPNQVVIDGKVGLKNVSHYRDLLLSSGFASAASIPLPRHELEAQRMQIKHKAVSVGWSNPDREPFFLG